MSNKIEEDVIEVIEANPSDNFNNSDNFNHSDNSDNSDKANYSDISDISDKAKNYVVSTLFNTSLFVMMSFVTKVINLIFHVLIARIISKESYGLATVYFNFIFLILLYFPRETLRKTCLKFCPDDNEDLENIKFKKACHLIWLINFGVLFCSVPISIIFIIFGGSNQSGLSEYKIHIFLYVMAAMLELIGEPAVIYLNIKIDKQYRLISMTLANYTRLTLNYGLALYFGMDLWSFTLARFISASVFLVYILYVGISVYSLPYEVFIPNIPEIINVAKNDELKSILNSFVKGTTLKMILNYAERLVLSFFLNISDSSKAEYTFVVENFATFIRFIIEPAEENFYNLINKIKHYKDLTVIPSTGEEFSGDFSRQENEILVKIYSTLKKKEKDKENYSFKLLKLSLKLFFVFGILLFCYIFIIGKDLLIYIFTEKWGTDHTCSILKVYSLYIGVLAVTSITEAYSNAICSNDRMGILNNLMVINAFLLVFLSYYLSQVDITGLVWASIFTLILRFFLNVYLIITTELEDQFKKHDIKSEHGNEVAEMIHINCIRWTSILSEMSRFITKSFMKTSAIISTIICVIILSIVKDLLQYEQNKIVLLFSAGVILSLNTLIIFMVEKKGFLEIIRLKSGGLRV